MSFIEDLSLKAIGSAFDHFLGQKRADDANEAARQASALQWKREYGAYKTRYQDTMADMRSAGLNPILAAGSGFNVGSGPSASMPQTYMSQAPPATSSALALSQAKKASAETAEVKAGTQVKLNQAKTELQKVINMRAQKKLITQQEKETIYRANKLLIEQQKAYKEVAALQAQTDLTQRQSLEVDQKIKNLKLLGKQLKYTLPKLKNFSEAYSHWTGKLLQAIEMTTRSVIPLGKAAAPLLGD